jgi:pyrimidine operon attenuation protein/uracil phosphoribosyltransferase
MPELTPPSATATLVLDGAAIDRALRRIAHEIIERNPDLPRIVLAGIPSRGIEVARRLQAHIEQVENVSVECGVVDVSMHRDDLRLRTKLHPVTPSKLPLNISGRTIILADDVSFTGRTCRAALDAINSFGRPARIQFAVLIDRGHRELPIRPDYVGKNLPTPRESRVYVRFQEVDGVADSVWVDKP